MDMVCGCPRCGQYMTQGHNDKGACCICPDCGFTCSDCMGTRACVVPKGEFKLPPGIAMHLAQYAPLEKEDGPGSKA